MEIHSAERRNFATALRMELKHFFSVALLSAMTNGETLPVATKVSRPDEGIPVVTAAPLVPRAGSDLIGYYPYSGNCMISSLIS